MFRSFRLKNVIVTSHMILVLILLNFGIADSLHSVEARADTISKIVFSSDRDGNSEIYVMDADGSGQKRLTDGVQRGFERIVAGLARQTQPCG